MNITLTDRLAELIGPTLHAMGFDLVRLRFTGGERPTLQIMAERIDDRNMSIEDCEEVSRTISAILDVEDPLEGAYDLEVSSPGVDRPLTRAADFERYRGHEARLELATPVDGRKRFKGVVSGLKDGDVVMRIADGETEMRFPLTEIAEAKLLLTKRLIEESLRDSKAREKARRLAHRTEYDDGGNDGEQTGAAAGR